MAAYVTGGKGGGGAVFSLAVQEVCPLGLCNFGLLNSLDDNKQSSVFAGTRSGKIKVFDVRSSPTSTESNNRAAESRAEVCFTSYG